MMNMGKILVAGMDQATNPFVKHVNQNNYDAIHLSHSEANIPVADGAIVALSHCSHDLMQRVKQTYKDAGRPILFASGGVSSIKDDFYEKFVKPHTTLLNRTSTVAFIRWFIYSYYDIGSKIEPIMLLGKLAAYGETKHGKPISRTDISNAFMAMRGCGDMEMVSHGLYRLVAVSEGALEYLRNLNMPLDRVLPKYVKAVPPPTKVEVRKKDQEPYTKMVHKEAEDSVPQQAVPQRPVPQEPVPQQPAPQGPIPQEPIPQEPVPQQPVPQEPVGDWRIVQPITQQEPAIDLLLEGIGSLQDQMAHLNRKMDKYTNVGIIGKLNPKLFSLSDDQINKLNAMIELMF